MNNPAVIHETIDAEVVIIHLDRGHYYSLDAAGADVWAGVAQGLSTDTLAETIVSRYTGDPAEIARSVRSLVTQLEEEELIVADPDVADGTPPPAPADLADRAPFRPPRLQKYVDMEELLLLDPIHEVDEQGWPHRGAA